MIINLCMHRSLLRPQTTWTDSALLEQPARWLEAITHYRATTSGGPNFANELCVCKIPPEQCTGLDLSSWKVAFQRYTEVFQPCGFRPAVAYPCYGLAEATLFVTEARQVHPLSPGDSREGRLNTARYLPLLTRWRMFAR